MASSPQWPEAYRAIASSPLLIRVRRVGSLYTSAVEPRLQLGLALRSTAEVKEKREMVSRAIALLSGALLQVSEHLTSDEAKWLEDWNKTHSLQLDLSFLTRYPLIKVEPQLKLFQ